jgi:hypothetical protein
MLAPSALGNAMHRRPRAKPQLPEGDPPRVSDKRQTEPQSAKGYPESRSNNHTLEYWTALSAFVALIASAVAAGFTGWQAFIANHALLAGQRAFVHLESIVQRVDDNWVSNSECNSAVCIYNVPRNEGKMIRSKFSFTNAGNTPTKNAQIFITCKLAGVGTKIEDPFMFLKRDYVTKRSIGAHQTIDISDVDSCNFKNNDVLLNAQMHVVPVFLVGEVTYEDWIRPRITHRTQFAHQLVVNNMGSNDFAGMDVTTVPVGKHNCTDDDCPE